MAAQDRKEVSDHHHDAKLDRYNCSAVYHRWRTPLKARANDMPEHSALHVCRHF